MAQLTRRELVCSLLTGLGSVGLLGSRGRGQTPARSPLTSALALATALVPNLEEVVSVYSKWLGFVVHWRGKVPAAEANFWEAPAVAGRPAAVLGPKDRDLGLLRFIEVKPSGAPIKPYSTVGWNVMEIRARNVDELTVHLKGKGSPFVHIGGPADLQSTNRPSTLRATQFVGPAGEVLYFTQGLAQPRVPPWDIAGDVGPLFITVLTANPYAASRDFYTEVLGMRLGVEVTKPVKVINDFMGRPADQRLTLCALWAGSDTAIEIDDFSESATKRPIPPGSLPPGVAICTLAAPDIEKVAAALKAAGVAVRRLEKGSDAPPYRKGPALLCRGRSGEILEFVGT